MSNRRMLSGPAAAATIGAVIVVFALLLWVVPAQDVQTHNVLHHLNFIPLLFAGMWFGWRGAAIATAGALLVQAPHFLHTYRTRPVYATDQVIELVVLGCAGIVAGVLASRERSQRLALERTSAELEKVYHELRENVEQLRKAERLSAAGQLATGLAHEIRNPLASIAGSAGILKRGNSPPENVRDCLDIIEKESQRLNKLLTSFLEFARPRAPRFQPTDVSELIHSVAALARHTPGAGGVRIEVLNNGTLPELQCDPEQMKQVLLNLLINAVEATPGGTVRVHAGRANGSIHIDVEDEGPGVATAERDRLFDPFFTTKEKGTGLGLAVASKIVEQHGGALSAHDNPAKGMTFRVTLPLAGGQSK